MMFTLPKWVLKMALAKGQIEYAKLIEYRLSATDVAELLGTSRMTVNRWSKEGKQGVKLRCRMFFSESGRPRRAYRMVDVRQFASTFSLPLHVDTLHPGLIREWNLSAEVEPS